MIGVFSYEAARFTLRTLCVFIFIVFFAHSALSKGLNVMIDKNTLMDMCGSQEYDNADDDSYNSCTDIATINQKKYSTLNLEREIEFSKVINSYVMEATKCDIVDVVCRTEKVEAVNMLISSFESYLIPNYRLSKPVHYSKLLEFESYRLIISNAEAFSMNSTKDQQIISEFSRLMESLGIIGEDVEKDANALKNLNQRDVSYGNYLKRLMQQNEMTNNVILLKNEIYKNPTLFVGVGYFFRGRMILAD